MSKRESWEALLVRLARAQPVRLTAKLVAAAVRVVVHNLPEEPLP